MGGNSTSNRCCDIFFSSRTPLALFASCKTRFRSNGVEVLTGCHPDEDGSVPPHLAQQCVEFPDLQMRVPVKTPTFRGCFLQLGVSLGVSLGLDRRSTAPQITGIWSSVSVLFGCQQLDQYPSVPPKRLQQRLDSATM